MEPGFLIVGAQRSGTTSLFRALALHPQVRSPLFHKGVHYFDVQYTQGRSWYLGHFPLRRPGRAPGEDSRVITGEASPYYIHHPAAPARIRADLPDVRLVVLLRDPVERAYSAYQHEVARGFEHEEFERALDLEPRRLAGETERLLANPGYRSLSHQHHAYVDRSRYARQVRRLFELFGEDRVLVLDSEDFFADPEPQYARLLEFLQLSPWAPARFEHANARPRSPMPEHVRARLTVELESDGAELERLLGGVPAWRR